MEINYFARRRALNFFAGIKIQMFASSLIYSHAITLLCFSGESGVGKLSICFLVTLQIQVQTFKKIKVIPNNGFAGNSKTRILAAPFLFTMTDQRAKPDRPEDDRFRGVIAGRIPRTQKRTHALSKV